MVVWGMWRRFMGLVGGGFDAAAAAAAVVIVVVVVVRKWRGGVVPSKDTMCG